MPLSASEIASQMRAALAVTEPDLDTSIGSTARKMLDAVAEVVAEASIDTYLLDYQYDIETKAGADLEDFVGLFGFSRLSARRATGSMTFERSTTAAPINDVLIPVGTQVATSDSNPVIVATVVPAILVRNTSSVSVPVQAVVGGTRGNVPANTLIRRVTPLTGVATLTNPLALSGGADPEADAALRDRFRRTVFRNLAGTEQMFLGVALDDEAVTHANAIGAAKRYREQLELTGGPFGAATSSVPAVRYTYPGSQAFGRDIDAGVVLTPGVHYSFSPAAPPVVTSLDTTPTGAPNGIYDLEFEYVPRASRNDPVAGITNRIDIYVNGVRPTQAVDVAVFSTDSVFSPRAVLTAQASLPAATITVDTTTGFPSAGTVYVGTQLVTYTGKTATTFTGGSGGTGVQPVGTEVVRALNDPMLISNFTRPDGTTPSPLNQFIPLISAPVIDIPNSLVIGAITYSEGTDMWLVDDITNLGGTPSSLSGIELKASTFADGSATQGSTGFTSATAAFAAGDVGKAIVSDSMANSTYANGVSTNASPTYTSATAAFTADDVGKGITGTNIPASTTILAVTNATTITLSANATASGSSLSFTITSRKVIRTGTTIATVTNTTTIGLSQAAAATLATTTFTFAPLPGTVFNVSYTFNAVPRDVDRAVRVWRLITTDVKVHQSKLIRLNLAFAVILVPGASLAGVKLEMQSALSALIEAVGFNGVVQGSDLLEVAHRVPGVDSVRFLTATDSPTVFGIQRVVGAGPTTTTASVILPVGAIPVVSTASFPSTGTVYVGDQAVNYTGVTPTAFTGVTGGTGTIPAGTAVTAAGTVVRTYVTPRTTLTLASSSFPLAAATLTVASTAAFPAAGSVVVAGVTVTYTGVTATTFTGCSSSGLGTGVKAVGTEVLAVAPNAARAVDVIVGEDETPVLNSLTLVQKATNTIGAVG